VRSDGGQEAWKKGCKRVSSADDRLMGTTQTVRERSRNIIRSLQGHDPGTRPTLEKHLHTVHLSSIVLAIGTRCMRAII
jgi:hypothetical protein